MDWIKLLFYINGVLLCSVPVKTDRSKPEKDIKEEVSFNPKFSNSTSVEKEILEESPSERVTFRNRSVFLESKDDLPVNKKSKTSKVKNDQKIKVSKDLTGEANIYSPVITFTESPLDSHWHIVPEIFPYTPQYRFPNPIPVIESQSFVNAPKLTYTQKNYKPVGNLQGRNVHSSAEYPEDYSGYIHHRHPEPTRHPHGHPVHTETVHDYGRFLPEDYKSKIEKEAELLIKRKKTNNTTLATATTNRPQSYSTNTQSYIRENQQSARGYTQRHQKPVNTAFFHKGNFESAYPFPDDKDNQNDERQIPTSEGYPRKPSTVEGTKTETPIKIGEPYNHRGGVTEMYHRDHSYPSEQDISHGGPYNDDYYHKNPHQNEPPPEGAYNAGPYNDDYYHKNPHQNEPLPKGAYNAGPYNDDYYHKSPHQNEPPPKGAYNADIHQGDQYNRDIHNKNQQYKGTNYKDRKSENAHQRDLHKTGIKHNHHRHRNPTRAISHDMIHQQQHSDTHSSTFRQQNENQDYIRPHDSFTKDSHHTGPPNVPGQYDSPSKEHSPAYTDSYQNPVTSHLDASPYAPQHYSQPEQQNLSHHNGENKVPWSHNTEFYQQVTAVPQKENYSSQPPETHLPPPVSGKFNKNSELHSNAPNRPLAKNPLPIETEKPYYNSFRSLMDLYKSLGFQSLHFDELPVLPTRFPFESPFNGKIEVSGPTSGYGSANNFIRPFKPPISLTDANPSSNQNFNNYRNHYWNENYDNKGNVPSTINYSTPYSNMRYSNGGKGPNSSSDSGLHYDTKYNSGEHGPSSVSYSGPHPNKNYNSGENGPSSVSYGGPHYNIKYNSGENVPSSVSYGEPHYDTKYNKGENGPSSVSYGVPQYETKYSSGESGPINANYDEPHYDTKHNIRENYPDNKYFIHTSSEGNVNTQSPQYIPHNTYPPLSISTEYYESPETSHPHHALNTQIETPKEAFKDGGYSVEPHSYTNPATYSPPADEKIRGIRVKDYDAQTYFGNSPQTNLNSPPESDFNSGTHPTNSSLYSHSVVRNNPYNIQSPYSGEVEEPYRPRKYRQKLKIEIDPSIEVSEERSNDFNSNDKTNKFHSSSSRNTKDPNLDFLTHIGPYNPHNEYQESRESTRSTNKNQQKKSKRKSKSQGDRDTHFNNGQEYSHGKKKKTSSKRPYEEKFIDSQPERDYTLPRHRKRSSHRSSRKHRSSDDPENMRAAGSTYHWGMERHKGKDGFFQYANVPGSKVFEYGYRMGGPEHTRERHHRTIGEQSKIKINWVDANGDSGDHYWEFNHNSINGEVEEEETEPEPKSKPKSESEESSEESTK